MNNDSMISWPFTLDYVIQSPLNNNGPIGLYPGMWVMPLSTYVNRDNGNLQQKHVDPLYILLF